MVAATSTVPGAAPSLADRALVAADLEGTCTAGETWRALGRYLACHGRRSEYRRFVAPRLAAVPLVRVGLVEKQASRNRWIAGLAARAGAGIILASGTYQPVAVAPDRHLVRIARERGWRILAAPGGPG